MAQTKNRHPGTRNPQLNYGKQKTENGKTIPLFYWSERKFIFKDKENYGDLLSKYLVEKVSGRLVKWVHPKKQPWYKLNKRNYLAIGSIIHHATEDSIVWGSGIIDRKQQVAPAEFRAVRGPRTREFLLRLGYDCPEVYGDPALLLPLYYDPQVEKKYKVGIIPHYHDFKEVSETYKDNKEIRVIDMMTLDVEAVTLQILECENTISSSLHGLIVSHAYGIPSVWVEFSDKLFGDGVKFADYLESVGLPVYEPEFLNRAFSTEEFIKLTERFPASPKAENLKLLQHSLLKSCPFPPRG
ncbi:Polysaccharide pyruvyl transferase [Salinimicrobium catena]|uniref:Polysaccharide pyruvyl transferase n=1 Tax=Salinimicrobium catena TaxID=390640 RepID=A0A1H5NBI3_9FLAO|nr:polysaccharide pyruvyl transferase family protein [Salinimicrobium catena]SDL41776.1 Polysaccharide pyruvyl transferase [Salinimicrobium catena]SEE98830.1 Polysaccharide pyruvyl transferase [Salinimicrobium catena]